MSAPYQLLPPLSPDERAALRASIEAHGVLQPIITDEAGAIIEGHHRAEIAAELGIDCPRTVLAGLSEEEKLVQAVTLNLGRRQLSRLGKRQLVANLIERWPERSDRAIARLVGVDHHTVAAVRRPGEFPQDAAVRALAAAEATYDLPPIRSFTPDEIAALYEAWTAWLADAHGPALLRRAWRLLNEATDLDAPIVAAHLRADPGRWATMAPLLRDLSEGEFLPSLASMGWPVVKPLRPRYDAWARQAGLAAEAAAWLAA